MMVKGKVSKIMDFGAFVELEPGIEGLIHISELSPSRVRRVVDIVKPAQEVEVRILKVEPEIKRIRSFPVAGQGTRSSRGRRRIPRTTTDAAASRARAQDLRLKRMLRDRESDVATSLKLNHQRTAAMISGEFCHREE